jgi:hypothetical protein
MKLVLGFASLALCQDQAQSSFTVSEDSLDWTNAKHYKDKKTGEEMEEVEFNIPIPGGNGQKLNAPANQGAPQMAPQEQMQTPTSNEGFGQSSNNNWRDENGSDGFEPQEIQQDWGNEMDDGMVYA